MDPNDRDRSLFRRSPLEEIFVNIFQICRRVFSLLNLGTITLHCLVPYPSTVHAENRIRTRLPCLVSRLPKGISSDDRRGELRGILDGRFRRHHARSKIIWFFTEESFSFAKQEGNLRHSPHCNIVNNFSNAILLEWRVVNFPLLF